MKTNAAITVTAILIGVGIGYWAGTPSEEISANEYNAIALDNNALLKKIFDSLNESGEEAVTSRAVGSSQGCSGLLSDIRKTINDSVKSLSTGSVAAAPTVKSEASIPSEEQTQLYNTVKRRMDTYAISGRPIIEAISEDPDVQNLTHEQQQQLALEMVSRFNRGEVTMDQITGR